MNILESGARVLYYSLLPDTALLPRFIRISISCGYPSASISVVDTSTVHARGLLSQCSYERASGVAWYSAGTYMYLG
jgi:hypothetical protein